jgi:hypothetical protein
MMDMMDGVLRENGGLSGDRRSTLELFQIQDQERSGTSDEYVDSGLNVCIIILGLTQVSDLPREMVERGWITSQ